MRQLIFGMLVVLALATTAYANYHHSAYGDKPFVPEILAFDRMYGVDGPFVGEDHPIRGIIGDEAPWAIRSAHAHLDTTGELRIHVRGLVFAEGAPADLVGKNDETEFRAAVSCLTEKSATDVGTKNVVTRGFPATESGDSDIDAHVHLPNPCVAPIVFILAGSEDKWFAVTGFESE